MTKEQEIGDELTRVMGEWLEKNTPSGRLPNPIEYAMSLKNAVATVLAKHLVKYEK